MSDSAGVRTQCVSTSGHGLTTDGNGLFFQNLGREYFRFGGDGLQRISKHEYFNSVFQGHYKQAFLGLTESAIAVGSDRVYATYYQASNLEVYDFDRVLLHRGEDFFDWYPVYDIILEDDDHLWYAAPTRHYVGKKSLTSQEERFGIGGTWDNDEQTFDHPEGLFLSDGFLYIADMGHHRVCRLDLSTYALDVQYRVFAESWSVWEYCRVKDREFVVLSESQNPGASGSVGSPMMQVHEIVRDPT